MDQHGRGSGDVYDGNGLLARATATIRVSFLIRPGL